MNATNPHFPQTLYCMATHFDTRIQKLAGVGIILVKIVQTRQKHNLRQICVRVRFLSI